MRPPKNHWVVKAPGPIGPGRARPDGLQAGTHPWRAAAEVGGLDGAGDVGAGPDANDDAALPDPPHAPATVTIMITSNATNDLRARTMSIPP
jgi:hypothetical protein